MLDCRYGLFQLLDLAHAGDRRADVLVSQHPCHRQLRLRDVQLLCYIPQTSQLGLQLCKRFLFSQVLREEELDVLIVLLILETPERVCILIVSSCQHPLKKRRPNSRAVSVGEDTFVFPLKAISHHHIVLRLLHTWLRKV